MYRIFIVEDDEGIASAVQKHLGSWGYDVKCVEDFSNVIYEFNSFEPHIVLMDISLPFYNGFYWCGEIRKTSKVPVVFISSQSDNMNIITAMNMGGDDFIVKPFDLTVLMAKIQAILRRIYDFGTIEASLSHNGAVLNRDDATFIYNSEKIDLTKNEYRILQLILEKKGTIVSRELLMEKLWETDCFVDENDLNILIKKLSADKKLLSDEMNSRNKEMSEYRCNSPCDFICNCLTR